MWNIGNEIFKFYLVNWSYALIECSSVDKSHTKSSLYTSNNMRIILHHPYLPV